MTGKTRIGWTDQNWNPTTGCHKIRNTTDDILCHFEAKHLDQINLKTDRIKHEGKVVNLYSLDMAPKEE